MDIPGAWHLMDTVRKLNELSQRARSGAPAADDYLQVLTSDPTTQWFTELLREKSAELEMERQRVDQLACALRSWHDAKKDLVDPSDTQLANALQQIGIIHP